MSTQQFITEFWNYKKIFTKEEVMDFTNWSRFEPNPEASRCQNQLLTSSGMFCGSNKPIIRRKDPVNYKERVMERLGNQFGQLSLNQEYSTKADSTRSKTSRRHIQRSRRALHHFTIHQQALEQDNLHFG
ncbi:hypothetical protein YC2023_098484 [Brassica napus]